MRYLFLRIILPALLMAHLAAAQQNSRTIFLVRHAEKVSAAVDALSPAGQQRAECLANTLKGAGIKQIYVTDAARTQQTAAPLAKALKLTPVIIPAKNTPTLLQDLFYGATGNALVVGHSDTLPFLIARLKAGSIGPIAENEYNRLLVVTVTEGIGTPVATLRYCDCGGAPPRQTSPRKSGATKAPAKKG